MATLGDAFIEIHADASGFERELTAELEAALIKAEATMRQHGRDAGNAFSDGVELAVKDRADDIGETLAEGLEEGAAEGARRASAGIRQGLGDLGDGKFEGINIPIHADDETLTEDLDHARRNIFDWLADVGRTISTGTNGLFGALSGNLGQTGTMIPIFAGGIAILAGGIIGLSQVLNPLIALLSAIPGLLGIIGVISLTLNATFGLLGEQAKKVFDAKTIQEFQDAIKDLSPETLAFITLLGRIKEIWKDISQAAQDAFLGALGDSLDRAISQISGPLKQGIVTVATALGGFFKTFANWLGSDEMKDFVNEVFPSVAQIIKTFGPPLLRFFSALVKLADATLPFVEQLFFWLGIMLEAFSQFIEDSIADGSFQGFLDNAMGTLEIIAGIIGTVIQLVKDLLTWLNDSGKGDDFLSALAWTLQQIADYLASEDGKRALEDLVEVATGTILILGFLFIETLKVIKVLSDVRDWIGNALVAIGEFFSMVWEWITTLAGGIYNFGETVGGFLVGFAIDVLTWITNIGTAIGQWLTDIQYRIARRLYEIWRNVSAGAQQAFDGMVAFARSIPGRIAAVFTGTGTLIYNAGRNLINGFLNGIKAALPDLTGLLSYVTNMLPSWKGPESKDLKILKPAGMAVMQGFRDGIAAGAAGLLGDLSALTGMISVSANPNTFNFGRGAIQQNFTGQPTPQAATSMGNATGTAIASTVNQQTMRGQMRAA